MVRFDGAVPFISVQVSHDPGQFWVLVFAAAMMAGLVVSLVVMVWVTSVVVVSMLLCLDPFES